MLLWGTYDLTKPRTRIFRDSLQRQAGEVTEVHADLWRATRDKSASAGVRALAWIVLRHLAAYPGLIWRFLRAPRPDVAAVGYMGHLDVLVLWPFARLRGVPVVWDMFLSLYDTVVLDRGMLAPGGIAARLLWAFERLALGAADLTVLDTEAHARRIEALFRLAPGRIASVPVGAEAGAFPALPPAPRAHGDDLRILFYGQFIPLHGIETIVEAARLASDKPWRWHLIGTGQEAPRIRAELAKHPVPRLDWEEWVPYERLIERIGEAHICLGVFGDSGKAASVVPNKVFQALSAARPIVTRDSPAMRELVPKDTPGIALVPPANPQALVDAIAAMAVEAENGTTSPGYRALREAIRPDRIADAWGRAVARVDRKRQTGP
ncbi:MAG TPA: glycosyltransferase [Thermohalobaculum sp.]|nr:glycosyltransferase [Thermohalobaculum sp.]